MHLLQNLHIKVSPASPLVAEEIELHNSQPLNVKWLSQLCSCEDVGQQEVKRQGNNGSQYNGIFVFDKLDVRSQNTLLTDKETYTPLWISEGKLKNVCSHSYFQTSLSRLDAAPHWVTWQGQRLLNRFDFLFPVTLAITKPIKGTPRQSVFIFDKSIASPWYQTKVTDRGNRLTNVKDTMSLSLGNIIYQCITFAI